MFFDDCRDLAVQSLGENGQTTGEAANSQYSLFRAAIAKGEFISSVHLGELSLTSALSEGDADLAGQTLAQLGIVFGRLRRYRQQIQALAQYLDLLPSMTTAQNLEYQVRCGLGCASIRLREFAAAIDQIRRAQTIAEQAGEARASERCRRLLRVAKIKANRLDAVPALFAQSKDYLSGHENDLSAHFAYWYDLADFTFQSEGPADAVEFLLKALTLAEGDAEREVECYLFLHRCASARADWHDALAFALSARLSALVGKRYDLAHEALLLMSELLATHGPTLLDGIERHFMRTGVNPFGFLPTYVLEPGVTSD